MQTERDDITFINANNGFDVRNYQTPQLSRFDLSHVNTRKNYIDTALDVCRLYDMKTCAFTEICKLEGFQTQCALLTYIVHRSKIMIRALMTSTTPFGVNWIHVIFYSRSLIWHFNVVDQRVKSYRPIADDISKSVYVKVSDFAAAMHQNDSVCYVRTFRLYESQIYALRLSTDCQIVDVYLDRTVLHILVKKDDLACFGRINLSTNPHARIDWKFYKWSDNLHVCNFSLCGRGRHEGVVRSVSGIDYTFELHE